MPNPEILCVLASLRLSFLSLGVFQNLAAIACGAYSLSHMYPRWVVAMAAGFGALMAAGRASAWQEAHQTGGDVEIHVDPDGEASVHDVVRWHVVRGPMHWIDLENLDAAAELDPAVTVSCDDGRALTAHLDRKDDHTARVTLDDPKQYMRGTFAFDVRWRVNWVKTGKIARDGTAWRLSWSSPLASDGFDTVRTTLDLPAAREVPAVIFADTGAVDDTVLSTLRREPTRDVLELIRPHVARGESVAWTLKIDPSAFGAVADPRLRPVSPSLPPEPDRVREASFLAVLGALALAFALLVGHKARAFATACAARGARARSLVPLPDGLRATLAGVGLAAGVGLQASGALTAGSALAAVALLAAASRPPPARLPARGPGRWLVLRPDEAFAPAPDTAAGHWLDASTRPGIREAWIAGVLVAALALVARRFAEQAPGSSSSMRPRWCPSLPPGALAISLRTARTPRPPGSHRSSSTCAPSRRCASPPGRGSFSGARPPTSCACSSCRAS